MILIQKRRYWDTLRFDKDTVEELLLETISRGTLTTHYDIVWDRHHLGYHDLRQNQKNYCDLYT